CNGIIFGDAHISCGNARVLDSEIKNHRGDKVNNDSGIGVKALNSTVTISNVVAHDNLKGFDLGENRGDSISMTYKVVNCNVYSNQWGCNFNCSADASYAGTVKFYLINNILRDNRLSGCAAYAGPFNLYVVHNVFDNNGESMSAGADGLFDNSNIKAHL